MKGILIILLFSTILISCDKEKKQIENNNQITSTYYFIRHAEKDRTDPSDKNPHLTEIGKVRANHWSEILGEIKFDAVYSTNYNRTKETAQPTATKNNLEIKIYDPKNIDTSSFIKDTKGQILLIVGHSNTTPEFVNKIIGQNKYKDIDDSNNGNLYIVTILGDVISDQLLVIN
jgi:phosphohistidine phosphatase SixA